MTTYNWYILQAQSGNEKKVAQAVREAIERAGISDHVEEIVVPVENVVEVKKGKKINTERKFFPGYILMKMRMDDRIWQIVKNVPKVNGFLGGKGRPQIISDLEISRILRQMKEGVDKPKHIVSFEVGETVRINDGPFESFVGVVEGVDEEKTKLKVSVSIFGRSTPVELEFSQVEKE